MAGPGPDRDVVARVTGDDHPVGGGSADAHGGAEPWTVPEGTLLFPAMAAPAADTVPELALQHTADGQLVAIAFTTFDGLTDQLGAGQPWLAVDHRDVPTLLEGSGVAGVLVDPVVTRLAPDPPG